VKLVGALNQRLNAPVTVSDMDLTLIARFPDASIRLTDVLAREVRHDGAKPDTLLHARELFLEFSLWDLFQGRYTLKGIHGSDVRLYPALDQEGRDNYTIWKSDSTSASSPLELERVSVDGALVRYRDARSALAIMVTANELALRGRFTEAENRMTLAGDLHLRDWQQEGRPVLQDRQATLNVALTFGGADGGFHIAKGELLSNNVPLEVTLDLVPGPKGDELDLKAKGLGVDLGDAIGLLPTELASRFTRYGMDGDVDLALRYAGPISGKGPSLHVGAKVSKGKMKERSSGATFSDIHGELALDLTPDGTPRRVLVKGLSARTGSGSLRADWQSNGLTNAVVKADIQADMDLADLLRFAGVDTLEQVEGRLKLDAKVDGKLRDVGAIKAADLRALRIAGSASLRGAALKGLRHRVTGLNADLTLNGNDATVQGLTALLMDQPLELSGTLRNLMPYLLFDDQRLLIEAKARSERMDLAALLRDEGSTNGSDYRLTLPRLIALDLQARIGTLVFEDFIATDISGTVRIADQRLVIAPLSLHTASGAVLGDLELDARGGPDARSYPLSIHATFQDIDVKELFAEFRDFGQDFIGHRHLSGRTRAQVALQAPLSPALALDMDKLVCIIDIALENGGIKGHAPLIAVADHLQKNKLVTPFVNTAELRRRLNDIRFERLENQIEIRNGAVHIPAMEVRSSAMDIELSGTHWFDDRIDHHLNFRLSDLFRMGKASEDEFGPIADDGTGMRIFLHMYGTASDPQFANDGAMAAARRKKQFDQEKEELRSILREELNIFRPGGTSTERTTNDPVTAPRFEVQWEEDSVPAPQPKERPRKGLDRLVKDTKDKDEQERIIIIED
ncbi:MAG TPA: AsmA-like C-terminal region-containing protein, partial [Flavobacteriales bacterium]|nr:AsmA-like C-terminal region-containing protein [Flavobacteriales bacterium]